MASSILALNMVRDLTYGFVVNGYQTEGYGLNKVVDTLNTIIKNHNIAQIGKANPNKLSQEDFIDYAHMKDSVK
jgi:hypothetical protein